MLAGPFPGGIADVHLAPGAKGGVQKEEAAEDLPHQGDDR
jgi:hypothetical protein